ncbi:MAG: polyamine aminopropyltransferase [Candidatus Handelsmanbacteria bacterium]|nr:polyamine aminopropyltransferase [Candidatus Handelsmanbacteria bacterium]
MAEARFSRLGLFLLLAAVLAVAVCSIIYELLIGSVSAYFLGDSVEQFSLTIGIFLFAMGVGSWLTRWIRKDLLARLIALELWLGLVGGASVAVLYLAYAEGSHYRYWMVLLTLLVGGLIGLELPLLTRLLQQYGPLRSTLADVLSLDYLGALVAALLFPYLLLPALGNLHTGLLTGLVNALVGAGLLWNCWGQLEPRWRLGLALLAGGALGALGALLAGANPLLERWESELYADRIVHSQQSRYQKIVLTRWGEDLRLYLDGHLQFAAVDERRYHEALVHPAISLSASRQRVLILGGGDGLSAREVLKYPQVEEVDLVDLDPAITDLARRHLALTRLNHNALSHPKVQVHNQDAFTFLREAQVPYGVIIADLTDPRTEAIGKLYSVEGYRLCRRLLGPGGVLVTQATSPYHARRAFWCIGQSLEEAGFRVYPYHALVPSFGEWGFHLAATQPLDLDPLRLEVALDFLRPELWPGMRLFDPDMERLPVEPNRLDRPVLGRYYREEWGE